LSYNLNIWTGSDEKASQFSALPNTMSSAMAVCAAPEIVRSAAAARVAAAPAPAPARAKIGGGASAAERYAALLAESDSEEDEGAVDAAERVLKAPSPLSLFAASADGKAAAKDCGDAHATTFLKASLFACTAPILHWARPDTLVPCAPITVLLRQPPARRARPLHR
jgi:hypothetical protein